VRPIAILRSVCCGIAAVVVSAPVAFSVLVWDEARREGSVFVKASIAPGGEIGFDLLTLMHQHPVATGIWVVAAFAIGFLLGWRVFARRSSPRTL
jgi:hypothetical protein